MAVDRLASSPQRSPWTSHTPSDPARLAGSSQARQPPQRLRFSGSDVAESSNAAAPAELPGLQPVAAVGVSRRSRRRGLLDGRVGGVEGGEVGGAVALA